MTNDCDIFPDASDVTSTHPSGMTNDAFVDASRVGTADGVRLGDFASAEEFFDPRGKLDLRAIVLSSPTPPRGLLFLYFSHKPLRMQDIWKVESV